MSHYLKYNLNGLTYAEGYVKKDSNGELQIDGFLLFPGDEIEFWYDDDYDPETSHYLISKIEQDEDNGKYYIEALGNEVNIEEVKIRLKTSLSKTKMERILSSRRKEGENNNID